MKMNDSKSKPHQLKIGSYKVVDFSTVHNISILLTFYVRSNRKRCCFDDNS